MKLKDYCPGLYILTNDAVSAKMKVYDYEDYSNWGKVKDYKDVVITHVMLRATRKGAYYIIKYFVVGVNEELRKDNIMDFKVNGKSLKSYLENLKAEVA